MKAIADLKRPAPSRLPKRERGKKTYENLLSAAQKILSENGVEALSSNTIVERAGVTIPMFYRYFDDKYALLFVLGQRLSEAQNEVYEELISEAPFENYDSAYERAIAILTGVLNATESFTGAKALMIVLRAFPQLAFVRNETSHELSAMIAVQLVAARPELTDEDAYDRSRLVTEIGYAAIEMLMEVPDVSRERILDLTARAIVHTLLG